MSTKSKGISGERELIHLFWGTNEWAAHRISGSGSSKFPSPDIIAGNKIRRLAIECKIINDNKKYFKKQEIEQLTAFSGLFGAEPWIAVKFSKTGWFFINPEDLEPTKNGLKITEDSARAKGLIFEELTKK